MDPTRRRLFVSVFFSLVLLSTAQSSNTSSLDSIIRDYAFKALIGRRTGVPYQVLLPANLSGIRASVIRLRSGSLWSRGSDSSLFHIPTRIITVPYVRRLILVYQDLGNWSSSYYSVPGYSLVAPVVGCLAYDASNTSRELSLRAFGDQISIIFPDLTLAEGPNSTAKCARFGPGGSVHLDELALGDVCSTSVTGHFTVVAPPVVVPPPPPSAAPVERGDRRWRDWVIAGGGGVVGLGLVGLVGFGIMKLARRRKMEEMESRGEGGERLGSVRVGSSVMPSATMVRTKPALEIGIPP